MNSNVARRCTAHHEAGHAVAAFYLQVPIRYATIEPTKDALGHVKNHTVQWSREGMFDDSIKGIDRAERHIVILYAGPLAQRKFRPESRWRQSGGSDFPAAMELFVRIAGEDSECQRLYSKLLWRRAELLVEHRWKDIRGVASALLERTKLDRTEIRAAIDRAHSLKPVTLREVGHLAAVE